jgi:hypothetical protein
MKVLERKPAETLLRPVGPPVSRSLSSGPKTWRYPAYSMPPATQPAAVQDQVVTRAGCIAAYVILTLPAQKSETLSSDSPDPRVSYRMSVTPCARSSRKPASATQPQCGPASRSHRQGAGLAPPSHTRCERRQMSWRSGSADQTYWCSGPRAPEGTRLHSRVFPWRTRRAVGLYAGPRPPGTPPPRSPLPPAPLRRLPAARLRRRRPQAGRR